MPPETLTEVQMILRELGLLRKGNDEDHGVMFEKLDKLNGRVGRNEVWRHRITGGGVVLGVLVTSIVAPLTIIWIVSLVKGLL